MASVLSLLLAIFKAVPALKQWWDQLLAMYIAKSIADMHRDDKAAIKKAIEENDQRDLERQVFNSTPGERSDAPNTIIRHDSLPNVLPVSKKSRD